MNAIIRFSLRNRLVIITLAIVMMVLGSIVLAGLPIDIFPQSHATASRVDDRSSRF